MTINLTDVQSARIDEEGRRRGIAPDAVIQLAVDAFIDEHLDLGEADAAGNDSGPDPASVPIYRPDLWFIGLASGRDAKPIRNEDTKRREEIARAVWEDSFGGTRPWTEPGEQDGVSQEFDGHGETAS